jgi:ABC-type glycerol-3-phosphate transport system substrate-binding protein
MREVGGMKRGLVTRIGLCLILVLLAGYATGGAVQAQQQPPQKVTLRWFFWTGTPEEQKFWEGLAADASQTLPNIEVKFETVSFNDFWPKLQTLAAAGQVPCIVGLQSLRTATFVSRGVYVPLTDFIQADKDIKLDDFSKGIIGGLSYRGKLYALPYDFGPYLLYYNKTLFQKAGVPLPKENWTWNDFLTTAKAMTREVDGNQVHGFAAPNLFNRLVVWIWSNGGDYANADVTESLLTKAETVEAIQWYADLIHKYKVAPRISEPANLNWDREQFYGGRVAMYTDGPWNFVNVRSKLKDDWDITLLPRGKAGSIAWVAGSGFGISSNCKEKQEAYRVIKFLTSTESLSKLAKAGRGYPARVSAVPAFYRKDVPPAHQELIQKQAETARPFKVNANWQETENFLNHDILDRIVVANKPAAETIKAAEEKFQTILSKGAAQSK